MARRARCLNCGRPAAVVDHTCTYGGRLTFDYPLDVLRDWHPAGEGLSPGFKDPAPLAISEPLPVLDVSDLDRLADVAGDLSRTSRRE